MPMINLNSFQFIAFDRSILGYSYEKIKEICDYQFTYIPLFIGLLGIWINVKIRLDIEAFKNVDIKNNI